MTDSNGSAGLDQLSPFSNPFQNGGGFNRTAQIPRGIPNFNSSTMFGQTINLKWASQYLIVVATAAVTLRLFSRKRFNTRFWWDDGCAVLASVLLITNQCMFSVLEFYGNEFEYCGPSQILTRDRTDELCVCAEVGPIYGEQESGQDCSWPQVELGRRDPVPPQHLSCKV